jgi:hypothetical protein
MTSGWTPACEEIGTDTKVATINAALHAFALGRKAAKIVAAFDSAQTDVDRLEEAWGCQHRRFRLPDLIIPATVEVHGIRCRTTAPTTTASRRSTASPRSGSHPRDRSSRTKSHQPGAWVVA